MPPSSFSCFISARESSLAGTTRQTPKSFRNLTLSAPVTESWVEAWRRRPGHLFRRAEMTPRSWTMTPSRPCSYILATKSVSSGSSSSLVRVLTVR